MAPYEATDGCSRTERLPAGYRIVVLLALMVALSAFPMDVMLPSYPALAEFFDIPISGVTLFVAAFAVGFAVSQFFAGPLSDVYGRKSVLITGLVVSIFGASGCLFADDVRLFIAFRIIQGVGCGCFVLVQTMVQDNFSPEGRQRIRVFLISWSGVCISVSPLLGTLLHSVGGWQGSFYVYISLSVLVLVYVFFVRGVKTLVVEVGQEGMMGRYIKVFRSQVFVCSWLISALAFSAHFGFIAISPQIFIEQLGMGLWEYSWVLLFYGVVYVAAGIVADRISRKIFLVDQVRLGTAVSSLAGVLMAVSLLFELHAWTVLLPMVVCTLGTTIVRPASASRAMNVFETDAGTAAAAGGTLMFGVAGSVSVLLAMVPLAPLEGLMFFIIISAAFAYALNRRVLRQ